MQGAQGFPAQDLAAQRLVQALGAFFQQRGGERLTGHGLERFDRRQDIGQAFQEDLEELGLARTGPTRHADQAAQDQHQHQAEAGCGQAGPP